MIDFFPELFLRNLILTQEIPKRKIALFNASAHEIAT